MFKKIIFSIVILSTYILAEPTQAQAMTMIKSNPALLNTPQAKAEMAKRGIDKSQVLQKVNSIPSEENNTLIEVENDIADNVQLLESKEDIVEEEKYILYANRAYV